MRPCMCMSNLRTMLGGEHAPHQTHAPPSIGGRSLPMPCRLPPSDDSFRDHVSRTVPTVCAHRKEMGKREQGIMRRPQIDDSSCSRAPLPSDSGASKPAFAATRDLAPADGT